MKVIDPGHGYLLDQIDEARGKSKSWFSSRGIFQQRSIQGTSGTVSGYDSTRGLARVYRSSTVR
jgi:hypothetical protein